MDGLEVIGVNEIPQGAKLVDVREDYEWNEGHAVGAVHIPMGDLQVRIDELDPDEDTYVMCRTSGRSMHAAAWLLDQGYSVFVVGGGAGAWLEAGLPMVSENGQEPNVR